jgi:hypothetical protein
MQASAWSETQNRRPLKCGFQIYGEKATPTGVKVKRSKKSSTVNPAGIGFVRHSFQKIRFIPDPCGQTE